MIDVTKLETEADELERSIVEGEWVSTEESEGGPEQLEEVKKICGHVRDLVAEVKRLRKAAVRGLQKGARR